MTLEDHFSTLFTTDPEVVEKFGNRPVDQWWFGPSSVEIGEGRDVPERPYVVWNELESFVHAVVEETSDARDRIFQLFVYDVKGDFTRINQILETFRRVAKQMAHFTTDDGVRCSRTKWDGFSGLFPDDGYDSIARFGIVRFTVSR